MRRIAANISMLVAASVLPLTASAAGFHVGGGPAPLTCNQGRAQQMVANAGVANVHFVVANALDYYFEGNVGRADNEYAVSKLTCGVSLVGECLGLSGLSICPVHP